VGRDNLVTFTDTVRRRADGTIDPIFFLNQAVGRTYGLEILLKHEVTRNFYGWVSYTLARSQYRRTPADDYLPYFYDQTHNLVAVASYRTGGGWEFGARFRLTTGRPETPIFEGTYDADADAYVPLRGEIRSVRRPTFHELDVRADKTWTFKTFTFGAYLDLINVYNAENPEATEYDYRFRERAPVRGVPILPTLGVKGQW